MNVPNALSVVRLLLVPVFVAVYFSNWENAAVFAACVYFLASVTDVLDGMIARKYNLITKLGRFLDPLADKLMAVAVIVSISVKDIVPVWAVIIFMVKELLMGLGAIFLYKEKSDVMPSNYLGKAATAVFFIVCMTLMLFDLGEVIPSILISIAVGFSIFALVIYFIRYMLLTDKNKKKNDPS